MDGSPLIQRGGAKQSLQGWKTQWNLKKKMHTERERDWRDSIKHYKGIKKIYLWFESWQCQREKNSVRGLIHASMMAMNPWADPQAWRSDLWVGMGSSLEPIHQNLWGNLYKLHITTSVNPRTRRSRKNMYMYKAERKEQALKLVGILIPEGIRLT